jgi:hypothetical protein
VWKNPIGRVAGRKRRGTSRCLLGLSSKGPLSDQSSHRTSEFEPMIASHLYWPDRHWSFVMVPDAQHEFEFVSNVSNDAVEIDRRAAAWFFYTMYPKGLTDHAATVYLAPIADSNGQPLEAGKTYKLRVPKDTKGQMKVNADGSIDLYFGPNAPADLESNWIPTLGKKPYVWLRLYGPADAFWNKTFKMPDVELMN